MSAFNRSEGPADTKKKRAQPVAEQKNASAATAMATETSNQLFVDSLEPGRNQSTKIVAERTKTVKPKRTSKPVVRIFTFKLTDGEVVKKAEAAGKKKRAHLELDAEFARVKADYKGRLEKLEREIADDLKCVEQRAEDREVMADEVHDYKLATVFWFYEGIEKERREMYPHERQLNLEIDEAPTT